jgi:hypothetical protein
MWSKQSLIHGAKKGDSHRPWRAKNNAGPQMSMRATVELNYPERFDRKVGPSKRWQNPILKMRRRN